MTEKTTTTHYLFLVEVPWAVGGGQGGGAGLTIPGDIAILGGAADGQGVNAVCIAVTVAAVLLPPSIPRSPHKDGTQTTTTLEKIQYIQTKRRWQWQTLSLDNILFQSLIGFPIVEEQINSRVHLKKGRYRHTSQRPVWSLSELNRTKYRKTEMQYKTALYDNSSLW